MCVLTFVEFLLRQFTVLLGIQVVPIDVPVRVHNLVLAIVLVELGHSPEVALSSLPLDSNGLIDEFVLSLNLSFRCAAQCGAKNGDKRTLIR